MHAENEKNLFQLILVVVQFNLVLLSVSLIINLANNEIKILFQLKK